MATTNRFSVLARKKLFWFATTLVDHRLAPEKRQNHYGKTHQYPAMKKSLINRIKIHQKGIAIAAGKSVVKKRWKTKI